MPAYIVVETDVHDPERYELYKQASSAAGQRGVVEYRGHQEAKRIRAVHQSLPDVIRSVACAPMT